MKKFTLSLAALCICGSMFAATALSVNLRDGTKATYTLSEKPRVTFDGDRLSINAGNASTSYLLADVKTFTFTDDAGIDDVLAGSDIVYSYDGNAVSCPGHEIRVFSLAGVQLVAGHDTVSLESLARGVYVVVAGKQTLKIVH